MGTLGVVVIMAIKWSDIPYELSEDTKTKALICDACDKCEEWGRCTASECKCFALSLIQQKDFVCPLGKF
jgi:hypothetical protein